MAKDRLKPCIYYVCKGETCKKYLPRKSGQKQESVKQKRQKDRDRHDNWWDY